MLWLFVPVVGIVGKLIYDAAKAPPVPIPRTLTILERNLGRLGSDLCDTDRYRVAILGQPGAGKSSLLKKMTKGRVRPLPVIGAQTDATDWATSTDVPLLSAYNQFTFVDVPGYDTSAHPTDIFVDQFPFGDFDAYVFIIRGKLRAADERIFDSIRASGKPVCIAKSFAESCDGEEREAVSADLQRRLGLDGDHNIGFFSNRSNEGISDIMAAIIGCMKSAAAG